MFNPFLFQGPPFNMLDPQHRQQMGKMYTDFDAVQALLMLSQQAPTNNNNSNNNNNNGNIAELYQQQQQQMKQQIIHNQIQQQINQIKQERILAQTLGHNNTPASTFNPNRRLLSPMHQQNARNRFQNNHHQLNQMSPMFNPEVSSTPAVSSSAFPQPSRMPTVSHLRSDTNNNNNALRRNNFNHPTYPTPSPSPDWTDDGTETDDSFYQERPNFIAQPPSESGGSDDLSDNDEGPEIPLGKLKLTAKVNDWVGGSIYDNLPEVCIPEFDKILRNSHETKKNVLETLNHQYPVNYEYNPKKSRVRTSYVDPQIADDRTKNNLASRRSRQRKKFLNQVLENGLEFDMDENEMLREQEKWMEKIIGSLESHLIKNPGNISKMIKTRRQCGFE